MANSASGFVIGGEFALEGQLKHTGREQMAMSPIHPGEHRAEELTELGMSAAEFARRFQVRTNRVTSIVNGRRAVTADTALRLAHFFGTTAAFWLNLQCNYDLRIAQERVGGEIAALPVLGRVPSSVRG
jgi:antitoxin HigA-1